MLQLEVGGVVPHELKDRVITEDIECVPKLPESGDRTAYVNLSSTRGRGVIVVVNGSGEGDNAKVVRKDKHMAVKIFHPANIVRRSIEHDCFAIGIPVHRLGSAGRN